MQKLDISQFVLEWGSEIVKIPYESPLDGRIHLYYVDFYVKSVNQNGEIEKTLIEIKPYKQTIPPKPQKRATKSYIQAVATWGVNESKWDAAKEFCKNRGFHFKILTEKDLGIQ